MNQPTAFRLPQTIKSAGSLVAVFSRPSGLQKRIGPLTDLFLGVDAVRAAAGGPVIAERRNHLWHVDGQRYSRLQLEGPVTLYLLRGSDSKSYGPYKALRVVDGVAFCEGRVFASVERDRNCWYCQEDGHRWDLIVIKPALPGRW